MLSGSSDNTARVWDFNNGKLIAELTGHSKRINAVHILPNNTIITASDDKTVCLWNIYGICIKQYNYFKDKITHIIAPLEKYFIVYGAYDAATYI